VSKLLEELLSETKKQATTTLTQKNRIIQSEWNRSKAEDFAKRSVRDLLNDSYFLNFKNSPNDVDGWADRLYPAVKQDVIDLFEEKDRREINFALFIEGIGSGKSTKAGIITWIQWYYLTCWYDFPTGQIFLPNGKVIKITPGSVIAFIFLNRGKEQARRVSFEKVLPLFKCPFNMDFFPPDQRKVEIRIPRNKTVIFPGTGEALSILGYDLWGGVIDEANFLNVIEDSASSLDPNGRFDAAQHMFNAVQARMKSRFGFRGEAPPGLLTMISSPSYPDAFLERKAAEYEMNPEKSLMFYRRRATWEAAPYKYAQDCFVFDINTMEVVATPPGKEEYITNRRDREQAMRERDRREKDGAITQL